MRSAKNVLKYFKELKPGDYSFNSINKTIASINTSNHDGHDKHIKGIVFEYIINEFIGGILHDDIPAKALWKLRLKSKDSGIDGVVKCGNIHKYNIFNNISAEIYIAVQIKWKKTDFTTDLSSFENALDRSNMPAGIIISNTDTMCVFNKTSCGKPVCYINNSILNNTNFKQIINNIIVKLETIIQSNVTREQNDKLLMELFKHIPDPDDENETPDDVITNIRYIIRETNKMNKIPSSGINDSIDWIASKYQVYKSYCKYNVCDFRKNLSLFESCKLLHDDIIKAINSRKTDKELWEGYEYILNSNNNKRKKKTHRILAKLNKYLSNIKDGENPFPQRIEFENDNIQSGVEHIRRTSKSRNEMQTIDYYKVIYPNLTHLRKIITAIFKNKRNMKGAWSNVKMSIKLKIIDNFIVANGKLPQTDKLYDVSKYANFKILNNHDEEEFEGGIPPLGLRNIYAKTIKNNVHNQFDINDELFKNNITSDLLWKKLEKYLGPRDGNSMNNNVNCNTNNTTAESIDNNKGDSNDEYLNQTDIEKYKAMGYKSVIIRIKMDRFKYYIKQGLLVVKKISNNKIQILKPHASQKSPMEIEKQYVAALIDLYLNFNNIVKTVDYLVLNCGRCQKLDSWYDHKFNKKALMLSNPLFSPIKAHKNIWNILAKERAKILIKYMKRIAEIANYINEYDVFPTNDIEFKVARFKFNWDRLAKDLFGREQMNNDADILEPLTQYDCGEEAVDAAYEKYCKEIRTYRNVDIVIEDDCRQFIPEKLLNFFDDV